MAIQVSEVRRGVHREIARLKIETTIRCPGQECSMAFMMSRKEFALALSKAKAGEYDPFKFTWSRKREA